MIFLCGLATAAASGVMAYRVSGPYGERDRDDPRVRRFYDPATGRLRLLVYDADGNGTFDTWSYLDGSRLIRIETDDDGDGLIDRWEYYGSDGGVDRLAVSSAHNGRPDTWQYPGSGTAGGAERLAR